MIINENKIVDVLGGERYLGRKVKSSLDLDKLIRDGFPFKVAVHMQMLLALPLAECAAIMDVSVRTWARLKKEKQRLPSVASDRLYRLARIYSIATEVMEDAEKAKEWVHKPQYGLGGVPPIELLQTEAGAKEVEELLWRIEYGIVS